VVHLTCLAGRILLADLNLWERAIGEPKLLVLEADCSENHIACVRTFHNFYRTFFYWKEGVELRDKGLERLDNQKINQS
jgi:hypothetical protein